MAKKPTISTVSAGYNSTAILNNDLNALRDAFDNTLSRDGSTPNMMEADIDLNGNDLLNARVVNTDALVLNGVPVTNFGDQIVTFVTPQEFGAVGDGVADDSPAFQAMINFALGANNKKTTVHVPAGNYALHSEVVATWIGSESALEIIGAGSNVTVINVVNTSGAFDFNMTALGRHALRMKGITFVAKAPSNALITRCIRHSGPGTGSTRSHVLICEDVVFEPDRANLLGSVFLLFMDLQELDRPHLKDVKGWGRIGPGSTAADWFTAELGVNMFNCFGPLLENVRFWSCHTGFRQTTTTLEGGQYFHCGTGGNNAIGCEIIANNRSVGNFFHCYFDSNEIGIKVTNADNFRIENTMFWASAQHVSDDDVRYDVKLENCQGVRISETIHRFNHGAAISYGIHLDASCSGITIAEPNVRDREVGVYIAGDNNQISDGFFGLGTATGVQIVSGAADNFVHRLSGTASLLSDAGVRTRVQTGPMNGVQVRLSTNQSVPNGEATEVGFNQLFWSDPEGWFTSGSITVPSGYGVKFVAIEAGVVFSSNNTGTRSLRILKNGLPLVGQPFDRRSAALNSQINLTAIRVPCVDGDVFSVAVEQTSGGALDVLSSDQTYVRIRPDN